MGSHLKRTIEALVLSGVTALFPAVGCHSSASVSGQKAIGKAWGQLHTVAGILPIQDKNIICLADERDFDRITTLVETRSVPKVKRGDKLSLAGLMNLYSDEACRVDMTFYDKADYNTIKSYCWTSEPQAQGAPREVLLLPMREQQASTENNRQKIIAKTMDTEYIVAGVQFAPHDKELVYLLDKKNPNKVALWVETFKNYDTGWNVQPDMVIRLNELDLFHRAEKFKVYVVTKNGLVCWNRAPTSFVAGDKTAFACARGSGERPFGEIETLQNRPKTSTKQLLHTKNIYDPARKKNVPFKSGSEEEEARGQKAIDEEVSREAKYKVINVHYEQNGKKRLDLLNEQDQTHVLVETYRNYSTTVDVKQGMEVKLSEVFAFHQAEPMRITMTKQGEVFRATCWSRKRVGGHRTMFECLRKPGEKAPATEYDILLERPRATATRLKNSGKFYDEYRRSETKWWKKLARLPGGKIR